MFNKGINEHNRQVWLKNTLMALPSGLKILDAGAGELQNKIYCAHLDYVSQDFCQYSGGADTEGLETKTWDTGRVDIVSDIISIPLPDASFDVILCSEVLEHVPEPTHALDEFFRLLKPGGKLILTAPFASLVHMAPYHYCSGFSKYWYEYHLNRLSFNIIELVPNGDWFAYMQQEISRIGGLERARGNWSWPIAYAYSLLGLIYFGFYRKNKAEDIACFGWQCVAVKI
jgi:ubiquinone/menaquinone biosynthesis C-methylase UbiE